MATMVVTGATSGIGRGIAIEFSTRHVSDCDSLVLCYRSDDLALEGLVGELSSWRGQLDAIRADLCRPEGVDEVLAALAGARVDYLSYNVGIGAYKGLADMSLKEWERVYFANVTAPVFLVRGLLGSLNKGGSVLFNGSCSGISPHSTCLAYGISKAALHFAARALVKELEPHGVRVNAIAPGFIDTPRNDVRPRESRERIERKIAEHRFGRVEEVARAALDILENTYINGSVISVDGGYEYY